MSTAGGKSESARPGAVQAQAGVENDVCDRVLKVLGKFMPASSAGAVVARAEQLSGRARRALEAHDAPAFFAEVEQCAAVLLDRRTRALLRGELEFELSVSIGRPRTPAPPLTGSVGIRSEWDVSLARARARELVAGLGGKSYDVVKVMTLVSELARNIVLYTEGGYIDFTPQGGDPPRLLVCASDTGPGIPNLDEVLSGRFRSKTGLGRGLLGARRLAHRFEIETSTSGTRIEIEVRF